MAKEPQMNRPIDPGGLPAPAEPLPQVQIHVNGQTVVGEVTHRSKKDIEVVITHPFIGLTATRHIPYFAPLEVSYLGAHGDDTAKDLLRHCHSLAMFLFQNLRRLQEAWARHLEAVAAMVPPEHFGRDAFLARRRALRSKVKTGELKPGEYQGALSQLKKANVDFEDAQCHAIKVWLADNFPSRLENDADLAAKVIPVLDGRVPLRPKPLTRDPFIRRLESLGIKVTRANYMNLVAPGADPDDLDAEIEASLPPELRLQGDGDE
jgi:hypothetical protein